MGDPNFASRIIRAFEAGARERRIEEELEQRRGDRDLDRKKLKFEMDRLKLTDETERQLLSRKLAVQNLNLISGTDPTPPSLRDILARQFSTKPSPIPSNLEGTDTVTPEGTGISRGRVNLPFNPFQIPGVESLGVGGVTVQPQTAMEELIREQALARVKAGSETFSLSPGQTRFVGPQPIANVPANPENLSDFEGFFEDQKAAKESELGRELTPAERGELKLKSRRDFASTDPVAAQMRNLLLGLQIQQMQQRISQGSFTDADARATLSLISRKARDIKSMQNIVAGDPDALLGQEALEKKIAEEDFKTSLDGLRAQARGGKKTQGSTSGRLITVINPQGQKGTIPAEDLEQAVKDGFKVVQ